MSFLYIIYQFFVIGFSMLGPGIMFAMLVFAQVTTVASAEHDHIHIHYCLLLIRNVNHTGGGIWCGFVSHDAVQRHSDPVVHRRLLHHGFRCAVVLCKGEEEVIERRG